MNQLVAFSYAIALLLSLCLLRRSSGDGESDRWYKEGEQFPKGDFVMPPTVFYSLYMGDTIHYSYHAVTIGSMKFNPMVTFVIIQIVSDEWDGELISLRIAEDLGVKNLKVLPVKYDELSKRIKDRLNIDVPIDKKWFYKLCDYKPTVAHLFPEFLLREEGEEPYKYWGYGDLDLVWGDLSKFASWFEGDPLKPFVLSGWMGTTGAAAWYVNNEFTTTLFMKDPMYVPLLADPVYHNLDEGGTQVNPDQVVDNGMHSISQIQKQQELDLPGFKWVNRGRDWMDEKFIDSGNRAATVWINGALKMLPPAQHWPPGRELMFYHRPQKNFNPPHHMKKAIVEDMLEYGFMMPDWTPLLTRFTCAKVDRVGSFLEAIDKYQPYAEECFGKREHESEDAGDDTGLPLGRSLLRSLAYTRAGMHSAVSAAYELLSSQVAAPLYSFYQQAQAWYFHSLCLKEMDEFGYRNSWRPC